MFREWIQKLMGGGGAKQGQTDAGAASEPMHEQPAGGTSTGSETAPHEPAADPPADAPL
jgi:hypothetical protein